jgi:hypothetical protein
VGFGAVNILSLKGGYDQAFASSILFVLTKCGPWR